MLRSLKVTNGWLKKVKQALSRYDFTSQKALAEELEISPRKVNDFFNGKTIEYEIFVAICTRLELDWQKVAKVSSEPKANPIQDSDIAPAAITAKNMEQSKKSEGIPKLASSLFKTFDSQERIAQKKFVDVTSPTIDFEFSDQSVDSLVNNVADDSDKESLDLLNNQPEEQVRDSHQDSVPPLSDPAIAPPLPEKLALEKLAPEKLANEANSKSKGAEKIHELLGINTNTTKSSSALNPVSIAQIQELLGMVADIKTTNQPVETPSPEPSHNPKANLDELVPKPVTANIKVDGLELVDPKPPLQEIEFTPPVSELQLDKPQLDKQLDKTELPHNPHSKEPLEEVIIAKIEAEILETFKPEQPLTETEFSPPKVSIQPDHLEPILTACYDACEVQDWDMAAAIVKDINLTCIKKSSDLASILDLYNQLLPLKWQDGHQKISDRQTHWQIIYNAGTVAFYLQKYTDAVNYYETASAIASDFKLEPKLDPESTSQKLEIKSLIGLGQIYEAVAQYQRAIKYYQQAQTVADDCNDNYLKFQALRNLGNIYYALRQYRTAVDYYQDFLKLGHNQSSRDLPIEVEFSTIGNLGNAYYNLGEYQTAISYQEKYLEIARAIGNSKKEAVSLVSLGFSYYALGLYQTAIAHYQDARAISDKFAGLQVSIFLGLGLSYQALKNYPTAVVCFHRCLEVARQVGDRVAEIKALYNLRKSNSYQQ